MQKCENCNTQFSWSKIFKSFWWTYKPIQCDNCGVIHTITTLGRSTVTALTIVPMLVFGYFLSPFNNIFVTISIGILISIVGFMIAPFVVRYKKQL
ncbi:TIGR04104 family putative zinc finger protein [Bacillus dakarensis]|uniref:TIGR04104 family putative zinc finger protein n=1 Tax=Robertmurraya dakarensis TaxID=1926278 RepID=UPI000982391D